MSAVVGSAVQFLNAHKQTIKNVVAIPAAIAGPSALYELAMKGRRLNFNAVLGDVGLVLNSAVSPMGVVVISKIVHLFFSSGKLESFFGKNTIFAVNPWHPRHVVSVASAILMAPAMVKEAQRFYQWAWLGKVSHDHYRQSDWMKRALIFNFLFHRVTLHLLNPRN